MNTSHPTCRCDWHRRTNQILCDAAERISAEDERVSISRETYLDDVSISVTITSGPHATWSFRPSVGDDGEIWWGVAEGEINHRAICDEAMDDDSGEPNPRLLDAPIATHYQAVKDIRARFDEIVIHQVAELGDVPTTNCDHWACRPVEA